MLCVLFGCNRYAQQRVISTLGYATLQLSYLPHIYACYTAYSLQTCMLVLDGVDQQLSK
jgi:hypothetical protein